MANDWQRFHWTLDARLDADGPALPPFVFRPATADEGATAWRVVVSALMMERAWNGTSSALAADIEARCDLAFDRLEPGCMVVQHGSRVIGASVLDFAVDAPTHLVTGPCILHEYRSRGLGTALLLDSLRRLRAEGLRRAVGVARVNSTVARFVYPKFGGEAELIERPQLAA